MRISDWSSDVCSSDLAVDRGLPPHDEREGQRIVDEAHEGQSGPVGQPDREPVASQHGNRQQGGGGGGDAPGGDRQRAEVAQTDLGEKERQPRSEEHTSELQSLMRNSYAVFCLKKKK